MFVRIALITDSACPCSNGEYVAWCERLVRGLDGHECAVHTLHHGCCSEPPGAPGGPVRRPGGAGHGGPRGRRARARFTEHFADLVGAVCGTDPAVRGARSGGEALERFAAGLYGLAELARECGGLTVALRSEAALRLLESACRTPRAHRAARSARVAELLEFLDQLERGLRPLSFDWYGSGGTDPDRAGTHGRGLAAADLCHVVGGGRTALPGVLAKRFFGTPLLVTEHTVHLREHHLGGVESREEPATPPAVRALVASFEGWLARETYRQADLVTPGNSHARRWQQHCGADWRRQRTVYPGMDPEPFATIGDLGTRAARQFDPWPGTGAAADGDPDDTDGEGAPTLVWVGRVEPDQDLITTLQAFAEVRRRHPRARLLVGEVGAGPGGAGEDPRTASYRAHCHTLAAQLFPAQRGAPLPVPPGAVLPDPAVAGRVFDAVRVRGAPAPVVAPGPPTAQPGAGGDGPIAFRVLGEDPSVLARAYAGATVVVRSHASETFPLSLVQAMLSGRATVSTDVGAVREVVGDTGLVVPARSPRMLAESCLALLGDREWRTRLGREARTRALERYTVEQNVGTFHRVYLELMSRRPHRVEEGDASPGPRPFSRPPEARFPGRWAGTGTRSRPGGTGRSGRVGPRTSFRDAGGALASGARAAAGGV